MGKHAECFSHQGLLQTTITPGICCKPNIQASCSLPTVSDIPTNSLLISPDFDILSMLRSFPKGTAAAGPSGLRVQHILDAASIPLQKMICSSLRDIVNLLASGKAPSSVSKFLAGGSLTP